MEKTFTNYDIHKELLKIILDAQTGYIETQPGNRKLFFENGNLVFAKSTVKGESFADILIEMGKISDSQMEQLKNGLSRSESLGKALREKGFADAKDLGAALKHQIMRIITRVLMEDEGVFEIIQDVLPEKMPKLKIATLPLFVKNILLIDAPSFPPFPEEEFKVRQTDFFSERFDLMNLPDHFRNLREEFDVPFTTSYTPEELDPLQFKKILYVFKIAEMIDFEELSINEDESLSDPLAQIGLPESSANLLSESDELFDISDSQEIEPLFEGESLTLKDFDPLESESDLSKKDEDVLSNESFLQDRSEEEPAHPKPEVPLEKQEAIAHEAIETHIPDSYESRIADKLFEEEEPLNEHLEDEVDPIEALSQALNESEPPTLAAKYPSEELLESDKLMEDELFNNQGDTIPSAPIDLLTKEHQRAIESSEDLDVNTEDQSELTKDEAATLDEPSAFDLESKRPPHDFPPEEQTVSPEPTQEDIQSEYILPEEDENEDSLQFFEKKRSWPKFFIPIILLLLVALTIVFREKIPFINNLLNKEDTVEIQTDSLSEMQPDASSVETQIEDVQDETAKAAEHTEDILTVDENETVEKTIVADPASEEVITEEAKPSVEEKLSANPTEENASAQPEPSVFLESQKTGEPALNESARSEPTAPELSVPSVQGKSMDEVLAESMAAFRSTGKPRYTLVFMVACQRDSVIKLMRDQPTATFFITERKSNGNLCYCLSSGNYESYGEARKARAIVPEGILKPGEKPWILKISL
ncbi:MAG: hypothetical protein CSA81_12555 [Acidobacteria bacterium]|nr:MAG: hypothetical protein CSA81_12555 [Acidobacteriota bacterium]